MTQVLRAIFLDKEHILCRTVQLYPGRDDAKKKKLADELVKAASAALDVPEKSFSVSILDVPQEEWTEKVYKNAIDPENKTIYRRPGY